MTTVANEKLLPARSTDDCIKSAWVSSKDPSDPSNANYYYRFVWNSWEGYSYDIYLPAKSTDDVLKNLDRNPVLDAANVFDIDLNEPLTFYGFNQLCRRKIAAKLDVEEIPDGYISTSHVVLLKSRASIFRLEQGFVGDIYPC